MRRRGGLVGPLFACLAIAALLGLRRLDVVEVRGDSMLPTLRAGDRLLVVRWRRPPVPGTLVLAPDPRDPRRELVKRVTSVTAEGVALRGDNLAASTDARDFGRVPARGVQWRVVARYWPTERATWFRRGGDRRRPRR